MLRVVLGVVAGYVAMALSIFLLFSGLYIALGAENTFLPHEYKPTFMWIAGSLVLGFVAALIGGFACRKVSRSGTATKVFAAIVLFLGLLIGVLAVAHGSPPLVRDGSPTNFEAMQNAQEAAWFMFVNPFVATAGILLGARKKRRMLN
jgi:amino acid transporter